MLVAFKRWKICADEKIIVSAKVKVIYFREKFVEDIKNVLTKERLSSLFMS